MKIRFTINKNAVTEEDKKFAQHKGFKLLPDTITEECYDDNGRLQDSSEHFIYLGKCPLFGMCCRIKDRYVFARWSRYDSVNTDLTDFAIECKEDGSDEDGFYFTTTHISLVNGEGEY